MKHLFVFLLSFLFLLGAKAQDSAYVDSKKDMLTLKFHTVNKYSRLFLTDVKEDIQYRYLPNENTNIGLALNHKWLGIALAFNPAPTRNIAKYGRTSKLDLQVNSYGRKIGFDLNLQYYDGYYLENPSEVHPVFSNLSPPKREDITTFNLGFSGYYVFNNEKFSYRAAFNQTEIQKQKAGSFVMGLFGSLYSMGSERPLTSLVNGLLVYPNSPQVNGGAFLTGGISAGYIYTYVYKRFYATLGLEPSLGLQVSYANLKDESDIAKLRFTTGFQVRAGLGYNSNRFFAGISALSNNQRLLKTDDLIIENEIGAVRFFIGTRFFTS